MENNILIIIGFLIFASLSFGAFAAVDKKDVITGCYPLTIKDAEKFNPPKFEDYKVPLASVDYKVPEMYKDQTIPEVKAILSLKKYRDIFPLKDDDFWSMLKNGSATASDFAGNYVIAGWFVGSPNNSFAIIDPSIPDHNKVYFPKQLHNIGGFDVEADEDELKSVGGYYAVRFRPDSSLLIVILASDVLESRGISYYNRTGKELKLVRFIKDGKHDCEK